MSYAIENAQEHFSKKSSKYFLIWSSVIIVGLLAAFTYSFLNFGPIGFGFVPLAGVPLILLILISCFVAPSQRVSYGTRIMSLIWGGAGATTLTFIIVDLQNKFIGTSTQDDSTIVQAPLVEEFSKGLILWFFFFFARYIMNSPLKGAAIGILSGAGFAFVENILYFGRALQSGGVVLFWQTVLLRSLQSFFVHSLATLFLGLLLGYVASRTFDKWWMKASLISFAVILPMTMHGLWNGMSSFSTDNKKWLVLYLFFWIPVLALASIALHQVYLRYMKPAEQDLFVGLRQLGLLPEYMFLTTQSAYRKKRKSDYPYFLVKTIEHEVYNSMGLYQDYLVSKGRRKIRIEKKLRKSLEKIS